MQGFVPRAWQPTGTCTTGSMHSLAASCRQACRHVALHAGPLKPRLGPASGSSCSSKPAHHQAAGAAANPAAGMLLRAQGCTALSLPYQHSTRQQHLRRRFSCSSTPSRIAWLDAVQYGSSYGNGVALEQQQPIDAILVLAGGLTPDGGLPNWVHRRLDAALDLHRLQNGIPPILCIGGGTPHKPSVIAPSGHMLHESTACATYLMSLGVAPSKILKETSSYDTVGNAYFSLCSHAIPASWRRMAVVTSAFHMPRSKMLFEDIYALGGQQLFGQADWFQLAFVSTSDEGVFTDHVLKARVEKEAGSRAHWAGVRSQLSSLKDFHDWFFQEHVCYAVPRQHEFGTRTIKDEELLESY